MPRVLGAGLALGLILAACGGGGGDGDQALPAPQAETRADGTEGTITGLRIDPAPRNVLAARATVDLGTRARVRGTAVADDGHTVTIPTTVTPRRHVPLPIVGLRADREYRIEIEAVDDRDEVTGRGTGTVTTGSLPEDLPELDLVEADAARMADGLTLFDVGQWAVEGDRGRTNATLLAMDDEGEVVWYHQSLFTIGDARLTEQGTVLMNVPPFSISEIDVLGRERNVWLPDRPEEVGDAIVLEGGSVRYGTFHHEANQLPSGNILALATTRRPSTERERAELCPNAGPDHTFQEDVVVEFTPEGEVVNEWLVGDVVDRLSVASTEPCDDWAHTNGVILDEERNAVIASARAINLLFAFRYEDDEDGPSGELLWSIGPDGTLPLDGEPSYGLHAPELEEDGTILVYDNGNGRVGPDGEVADPPYSRAVRYRVDDRSPDPDDWSATEVWVHRAEDRDGSPLYADFLGDADLLPNGNVLVGHGGIGQEDPPARGRIVEVTQGQGGRGGEIVFDLWLPDTYVSYRAERIPSLYAGPRWDPATIEG